MRIILGVLLLITIISSNLTTHPQLELFPIMWSYFSQSRPSFYVNIESDINFSHQFIDPSIFQKWFGLHLFSNNQLYIKEAFKDEQAMQVNYLLTNISNQVISLKSNQHKDVSTFSNQTQIVTLSISLEDICGKYFISKPKFMVIDDANLYPSSIFSAFWDQRQCVPQVLLIKSGQVIEKYLISKNFQIVQQFEGYSLFIHKDYTQSYRLKQESASQTIRKIKLLDFQQNLSDITQIIKQNHPLKDQKIGEDLITVYNINTRLVSIQDIIDKISFTHHTQYLLLQGYSKNNMVVIDRLDHQYKIQTHTITNKTFTNITLLDQSPIKHILILHESSKPIKIFQEELKKRKCDEFHVDEQVVVKIRGNVGGNSEKYQQSSYIEQTNQQKHRNQNIRHADRKQPNQVKDSQQSLQDHQAKDILLQKEEALKQTIDTKEQKKENKMKALIIVVFIAFGLILVFIILKQIITKRALSEKLKQKTKIKKVDLPLEQISISQSDTTLECN